MHLDIRNSDGSLQAFITTALPEGVRDMLEHNLLACLEDSSIMEDKDTSSPTPGEKQFRSLHFSWYNRHCAQVSEGQGTFTKALFNGQRLTLLPGK
jgi:hypothetical protein